MVEEARMIADERREHHRTFDSDTGELVLEKKGGETQISFPKREQKLMIDNGNIHNHPIQNRDLMKNPDLRNEINPIFFVPPAFSKADIQTAYTTFMAEARVAQAFGVVFYMHNFNDLWTISGEHGYLKLPFQQIIDSAYRSYKTRRTKKIKERKRTGQAEPNEREFIFNMSVNVVQSIVEKVQEYGVTLNFGWYHDPEIDPNPPEIVHRNIKDIPGP